MKLVSYLKNNKAQLGLLVEGKIYDCDRLITSFPATMNGLLESWDQWMPLLAEIADKNISRQHHSGIFSEHALLLAPVPYPGSCRDGYAFRQHVETARMNRGADMIPEFDQYPVFYFTNHRSIYGPGEIRCMPDHFQQLDFELEVAIVICKKGRNIKASEADNYIGGLMIMNDFSARKLQLEEMLLNLGPAKGKDFATAIGPWLVTTDELSGFEVPPPQNHTGRRWNLHMACKVNGITVSEGNLAEMDWTFAEIIERASYGADLYPGDLIGSGTVGTGCLLELNGTGKRKDSLFIPRWLQPADTITLEVEGLGSLSNTIVQENNSYSILANKKI